MDLLEKDKFKLHKSRNAHNHASITYLWCHCTYNSKTRIPIKKMIAKMGLLFFKIYGIVIDSRNIGGGLRLPHLNGIYIHGNVTIGENCTILQQVTIGANEHKIDYKKVPRIGNRVYIGAGAKIIGDITIGDDVRIGANAIVTKSIPDGKTVVGCNVIKETKVERDGII